MLLSCFTRQETSRHVGADGDGLTQAVEEDFYGTSDSDDDSFKDGEEFDGAKPVNIELVNIIFLNLY